MLKFKKKDNNNHRFSLCSAWRKIDYQRQKTQLLKFMQFCEINVLKNVVAFKEYDRIFYPLKYRKDDVGIECPSCSILTVCGKKGGQR